MTPSNESFPKIDLTTFAISVSSAVYVALGLVPDPSGKRGAVQLDLARHNIDLLELLFEKTRGNRTPAEDKLFEQLLLETRMRFVEASKQG